MRVRGAVIRRWQRRSINHWRRGHWGRRIVYSRRRGHVCAIWGRSWGHWTNDYGWRTNINSARRRKVNSRRSGRRIIWHKRLCEVCGRRKRILPLRFFGSFSFVWMFQYNTLLFTTCVVRRRRVYLLTVWHFFYGKSLFLTYLGREWRSFRYNPGTPCQALIMLNKPI